MVSLCVNEKLNDSSVQELESWEIEPSVFGFKKNVYYYGFFLNGWDGYWYGFCNSPNSSGNASGGLWGRPRLSCRCPGSW